MLNGSSGDTPHSRDPSWPRGGSSGSGSSSTGAAVRTGVVEELIVDSRNSAFPVAWRERRAPHHQIPASSRALKAASMKRSSAAKTSALHCSHAHGFVHVHRHEPGDAGFVHRHADQLRCELHGALVVRDEYELHTARHITHDIAETPDIVLIKRRVNFVQ